MKARTVIITGSTRGIGEGAARYFLENGDKVVIFCRHKEHGDQAFERLKQFGQAASIFVTHGDVSNYSDVKRIVKETIDGFGSVDVLFNNAGVAVWKMIEETSEQDWDAVLDINLKGQFLFMKEVVPIMKKQGRGVVINNSSGLGVKGAKNYSAYCASKFGIIGLTESVAEETSNSDIKIYAVLPGTVATRLHLDIHPWEDASQMMTPEHVGRKIFELAAGKKPSGSSIEIYR